MANPGRGLMRIPRHYTIPLAYAIVHYVTYRRLASCAIRGKDLLLTKCWHFHFTRGKLLGRGKGLLRLRKLSMSFFF